MSAETHVLYTAPDISCDHCRRAVEGAVSALDGVESVQVDVAAKTVDVRLSGAGADAEGVRAAIEAAGYPVAEERVLD
jgi:copper chaperone